MKTIKLRVLMIFLGLILAAMGYARAQEKIELSEIHYQLIDNNRVYEARLFNSKTKLFVRYRELPPKKEDSLIHLMRKRKVTSICLWHKSYEPQLKEKNDGKDN